MSDACISTARASSRVDQPDHRRLARQILQTLEVAVAVLIDPLLGMLVARRALAAPLAIKPRERRLDIGRQGGAPLDALLERECQRAGCPVVQRVGHGNHHRGLALGDRDHAVLLQERGPDLLGSDGRRGKLLRRQQRGPDQPGIDAGQVALRHQPKLGCDPVEPFATLGLQAPGAVERSGVASAARPGSPRSGPRRSHPTDRALRGRARRCRGGSPGDSY